MGNGKGKAIPVQAWTGPVVSMWLSLPTSRQSGNECGQIVSPTHQPPLLRSRYSWYSFLLEAESTPGPQRSRKDYVNEEFQSNPRPSGL